jgi:hypothetical protein
VRSGVEGSGQRKGDSAGLTSQTQGQLRASNNDGYTGDHLWKVHHRTDDHITYTRRNSGSVSQGQGQLGDLRRIGGSGSDSVSVGLGIDIQFIYLSTCLRIHVYVCSTYFDNDKTALNLTSIHFNFIASLGYEIDRVIRFTRLIFMILWHTSNVKTFSGTRTSRRSRKR